MYLIFDASPQTKPASFKAPFSDTVSWGKLVHLSWILLDENFKPIEDYDCVVKPPGEMYGEKVLSYARLEPEDVTKKAVDVEVMLEYFKKSVDQCMYMFAHNLNVNENLLAAEHIRNGIEITFFKKERFCLMQEGTYYAKMPARGGGYKWPSLTELHAACFNSGYTPANNARADVIAAARCFIKLMKTGAFEDLFD